MRICVLGGDGYLGWPTSMYLSARGHDVLIVDNLAKRGWEADCKAMPLWPVPSLQERIGCWKIAEKKRGRIGGLGFAYCDISRDYGQLEELFAKFRPEAIIHYAEQPSGPYSMASRELAVNTQRNNVVGTLNVIFAMRETCPDAHLIKLGTMGEYGTPNIDIEEGWLEVEHNGRRDRVLYPKRAGSFYHLSKVHDSNNLEFVCRIWDFRVTDLNQGVVYGIFTDEIEFGQGLHTSFHYDAVFGTVLNRFIAQAVAGVPLTVYGSGNQVRGFLNIRDTLRCVELAALNPAKPGEFRVFNQFTEQFSLSQLAVAVSDAARSLGITVDVAHIDNPRVELDQHYYNAKHQALEGLGLKPRLLNGQELLGMIQRVVQVKNLIDPAVMLPQITWKGLAATAAMANPVRAGLSA